MPEAVETKKRRLYRLLDNLSSTDLATTPSKPDAFNTENTRTAAERFDDARERASKRLRCSTSSLSLPFNATRLPRSTSPAGSKRASTPLQPPNYSPWSHDAFLARLKTFSRVTLWHPGKPDAINEVQWAKRGWVCVDVNTVACRGGCERRMVISMTSSGTYAEDQDGEQDDNGQQALEAALTERYKTEITNAHAESCLWRKSGCKDDIHHLQVIRPSIWQPELAKRVKSAVEIQRATEQVTFVSVEREGMKTFTPERLASELPANILDNAAAPKDTISTALDIALHGWRGSTESGSELLHCDACFQRVGLWMYQPGYRRRPAEPEEEVSDPLTVNLIELHRDHCPWRNAASQNAPGSLQGLNATQVLARVVTTFARDHRRRSNESAVDKEPAPGSTDAATPCKQDPAFTAPSTEDVASRDRERESRLRKLKRMLTIKRRSKVISTEG